MDKRYKVMKERLSRLSLEQLQRIKSDINSVCLDTYNYDKNTNTFCPLAVAFNLHKTLQNPTNNLVIEILAQNFTPVNILNGLEGTFYTGNSRKSDLLSLVDELILSKTY